MCVRNKHRDIFFVEGKILQRKLSINSWNTEGSLKALRANYK